ncbi:MAG TPA: flagellar motor switch protein FliG [Candidatus Dormibacteraeota bacterium]|nr:flagellar motor switch protein FliG [Candidatus Dormibacteraeota bacterium]
MSLAAAEITGLQKAAILLIPLGDDAATAIYRHLNETELQQITEQIASLQSVPPDRANQVLTEFHRLTITQESIAAGGIEVASKMLTQAFGETTAKALLEQVAAAHEETAQLFESLQKTDPQQLVRFVESEHPQTIAMVLAHMGTRTASSLLVLLPEKLRGHVVKRLAEMQACSPEMAQKISQVLHRKIEAIGDQVRRSYGGVKIAAELLNRIDPKVSKSILENVESEDAKLALSIRNSMFTFEDLLSVPESGIRDLLSSVDKKSLATALKGAPEDLKNHIFKTMSSRAVEMLKEDMEALGPVRAQTVVQAQQEIVQAARTLETEGKLVLNNDQQEAYIV